MTIIGAAALDWDSAIVWADSEVYTSSAPTGSCNKLIISPFAGIVGAGTGDAGLMEVADRAVLDAEDIDDLAMFLPGRLLRAAAKATDRTTRRPAHLLRNTYLATGFSRAAGRVLVHIFEAWGLFEPRVATRAAAPAAEFSAGTVSSFASVVPIARAQMAIMRQTSPKAAGTLCAAHLGPAGITTAPIYDFSTGARIAPRARASIDEIPLPFGEARDGDAEAGACSIHAPAEAHPMSEKVS